MYQKLAVLIIVFLSGLCKIIAVDSTLEEDNVPPHFDKHGGTSYNFRFKTSNGIERSENGLSRSESDGNEVYGFYSYTRPDGKKETVSYVADKLGFRVRPKPIGPPPESISTAALAALVG